MSPIQCLVALIGLVSRVCSSDLNSKLLDSLPDSYLETGIQQTNSKLRNFYTNDQTWTSINAISRQHNTPPQQNISNANSNETITLQLNGTTSVPPMTLGNNSVPGNTTSPPPMTTSAILSEPSVSNVTTTVSSTTTSTTIQQTTNATTTTPRPAPTTTRATTIRPSPTPPRPTSPSTARTRPTPGPLLISTPPTQVASVPQRNVTNCTLGDSFINVLFNVSSTETSQYSVEFSIGVVGNRDEIVTAIANRMHNHSRQEIEDCLNLYLAPQTRPIASPNPSGQSHLSYHRPQELGGVATIPVQQPPNDNFVYGHGYTTYLHPFNVAQRVPEFRPHPYAAANSFQDLFFAVYRDFRREWNRIYQHGQPAFWFGRPAVTRPPSG